MVDYNSLDIAAFRSELSKERKLTADLAQKLKDHERKHTSEVNHMQSLLEAEQERSLKLKHLLSDRNSAHKATLEGQLQEALDSNARLKAEVSKLKRFADYDGLEKKLREQESKNYALTERVKELEREVETVRVDAVRVRQLAEIRDKETKIVELTAECADLQDTVNEYDMGSAFYRSPEPVQRLSIKDISHKADDLEAQVDKATIEKWQLAEEIQDLKAHYESQLQSLFQQTKQEAEVLKTDSARLQIELKEALDELEIEREKAVSERERRRQLMDDMHVKEDTIERLQADLDSLGKSLASRQLKIEKLENEMSQESYAEYDFHDRIKELTRQNSQLTSQLRESEAELRTFEVDRAKLEGSLQAVNRELKKLQHDKKDQAAQTKRLEEELEAAKEALRHRDERLVAIKDDLQQEMTSRILELRHEKLMLEERIEELQENADFTRRSIELSIHDELASLDDFRPNRLSTPKDFRSSRSSRFFGDTKQTDSLKVEIGEKDYVIKTLRADKEALERQVAELHQQVYQSKAVEVKLKTDYEERVNAITTELKSVKSRSKHQIEEMESEIIDLRTEIDKGQRHALRSSQLWAEENNLMRADLLVAERAAISAKLQYAEAATDLEILLKKFNDSKPKKKRFFR